MLSPEAAAFFGRALLTPELHCTCLLDFIFLIGSVEVPVREETVIILSRWEKKIFQCHALKRWRLKSDLWEGSALPRIVPAANFLSLKSNEVPGCFSEGFSRTQTCCCSRVQALPCTLLSCQFSALFLSGFYWINCL